MPSDRLGEETQQKGVRVRGYRIRPNWQGMAVIVGVVVAVLLAYGIGTLVIRLSPAEPNTNAPWIILVLGKILFGVVSVAGVVVGVAAVMVGGLVLVQLIFKIEEVDADG